MCVQSLKKKWGPQMRRTVVLFAFIFTLVVGSDQWTKHWSQRTFLSHESLTNIRDYLSSSKHLFTLGGSHNWVDFAFTYTRNTGAAWGLFGNLPDSFRPIFFIVLTLCAIALVFWFFCKTPAEHRVSRIGIMLIFSGAFGNLIDRAWLHYVRDWIHVQWSILSWDYNYPVFNIADSAVTIGVVLLIFESLMSEICSYRNKRKTNGSTISEKLDP